jgi:hypothetical protein
MDVIVDTCILFPDPFMQSNNSKDLFQHLRTTDSRLVILPIVFDEIVAKHEEELTKRHQKACDASESLNGMTLRPLAPHIGDLNLPQETRILSGVFDIRSQGRGAASFKATFGLFNHRREGSCRKRN